MNLIISSISGIEDLLAQEIKGLNYKPSILKRGKILVPVRTSQDIVKLNLYLRQANRVFLLLLNNEACTLAEIYELASTINYSEFIHSDQTFAVRGSRKGNQDFLSREMAAQVGRAIVEHFQDRKSVRIRADLKNPDIEFFADLTDTDFLLTMNTSGPALHKRYPKPFKHVAPLNTCLAASLLNISSFTPESSLLDPMSGGGTIPIEASLMAQNIPAGYFRTQYAFHQLQFVDQNHNQNIRKQAAEAICDLQGKVGAADRYQKNIEGLLENIKALNLRGLSVYRGLSEKMDYIQNGEYKHIVTNPPYGLRVKTPGVLHQMLDQFPKVAQDKGVEEIVLLTPKFLMTQKSLQKAGYAIKRVQKIGYGKTNSYLIQAKL